MAQMIFVNLPVKDLAASTEFYVGLGFSKNNDFSDDNASSIAVSDSIVIMLLKEEFFKTFLVKDLGDYQNTTSTIVALSRESREDVDTFVDKALASGGSVARPTDDYGFMYLRSFFDPNGHMIEVGYMDLSQMPTE